MAERIQKLISAAGLASRREAERFISAGRVTVNGETAKLGDTADPLTDDIRLDGKSIGKPAEPIYIMLNKPRGYVTSMKDDRGRRCVAELTQSVGVRLYPVGRLDLNSEGLLIMTNDGEAANALMHPSHEVTKIYKVSVSGDSLEKSLERLGGEFTLDGRQVCAVSLAVLKRSEDRALISIGIQQGLNRQIRRMCEISGLRVLRLCRVAEGELRLGSLGVGKWRFLDKKEIAYIKSVAEKLQI